ncbi:MAG TPA: hypothetical protein VJ866_01560 [Pyrinomonadaceae bacterium]|nr:hypothetical protein [Pyrinomonadaceae bacterium]
MKLPSNNISPELAKKVREKYFPPKPARKPPPRPPRVVKGGGKGK